MSVYADIYQNVEYPLICTRGIIVFPNQEVIIDVGRSASVEAVNIAKSNFDSLVCLVTQKDVLVEQPAIDNMYKYGTLCHIESVRKDKDIFKVKVKSLARARTNNIYYDGKIFKANISVEDSYTEDPTKELVMIHKVVTEFSEFTNFMKTLPKEVVSQLTGGVNSSDLSDQFAQFFPMELKARQQLLEETNVGERLMLILKQFEISREMKQIEDKINEKVKDSVNDSQKEYYLRERLKAIKDELNEGIDSDQDSDSLLDYFENNPYPQNIKDKAKEEIARYEMMPAMSSEASVIRGYLEWLQKVPYWQESEDCSDINEISKILDEDHYGIKKVKERVLEYIAVKNMTSSLKAPIICLYGPPGVGKTSLAKSIARALNRQFVKISLGGVRDEAEIRGHRRTYLGSMPGRIIQV